jgi:hypothetical protein
MPVLLLGLCHMSTAAVEKKSDQERSTYIVHMAKSEMPAGFEHRSHWYDSSLKSISDSAEMLYTFFKTPTWVPFYGGAQDLESQTLLPMSSESSSSRSDQISNTHTQIRTVSIVDFL